MNTSEHANEKNLQDWYHQAAQQPWSVDALLRRVRVHDFKTQEQQRNEFGATPEEFSRLQAMHAPREDSYAMDARRIAQARHLQHPNEFVQAMLLARQLTLSSQATEDTDHYYQAAFDAVEDLDADLADEADEE